MEGVTWEARIPSGHMWLALTYTISFHDDDAETVPSTDAHFEDAGVGLSEELQAFLKDCIGETELNKKEFKIRFSDCRDFMRFKLLDLESRSILGK